MQQPRLPGEPPTTLSLDGSGRGECSARAAGASQGSGSRVESFGRVHCAVEFGFSNVAAVAVDGGYVVIDTGCEPDAAAKARAALEKVVAGNPRAIIYTHFHHDHIAGAGAFYEPAIPIWAQARFCEQLFQFQMLPNAQYGRAARQFGYTLDPDVVGDCGIGPPLRIGTGPVPRTRLPTDTFDQTANLVLGGVPFELRSAPGETPDHLFVWLPEQRVLCAADNIYKAFPNIYAIRGVSERPTRQWIQSLDQMRRLDPPPEVLLMGHTEPVVGAAAIRELLTVYRDAIAFVHDSVLRMANAGHTPDEMVAQLRLPPHLSAHPYLREVYGTLRWSIRGVYGSYLGWYDGNASGLDPLTAVELAARLGPALGGKRGLLSLATEALDRGDFRWAAWLCDLVLSENHRDRQARGLKAEALARYGRASGNPLARNWCLTDAAVLRGQQAAPNRPPISAETVAEMPIEQIIGQFPLRLDPRHSARRVLTVGFSFSDSGKEFTFHIRRGVGEVAAGLRETPDILIRASETDFKRILVAGEVSSLAPEFWRCLTFEFPSRPGLTAIGKLWLLNRFNACMLKP